MCECLGLQNGDNMLTGMIYLTLYQYAVYLLENVAECGFRQNVYIRFTTLKLEGNQGDLPRKGKS